MRPETSATPADTFDTLMADYRAMPWLTLLRALEVEQFRAVRGVCAAPILDLGCGDGTVASLAFGTTSVDAGVDVDFPTLQRAARSGVYRLLVNADAQRLPFSSGMFRTVYSNGAMEHMDNLDTVLAEIARVMRRGGTLVTLVPSDRFKEPIGRLARFLGSGVWTAYHRLHHHVNLLSPDQWNDRLRAHGLALRSIQHYGEGAAADFIASWDLWSKVHLAPRPPFLRLRHGGNLGRWMLGPREQHARRLFVTVRDGGTDGPWLTLVAERGDRL